MKILDLFNLLLAKLIPCTFLYVYVRVEDSREEKGSKNSPLGKLKIESYLVTSKARVTPTKAEDVSRLELNSLDVARSDQNQTMVERTKVPI